LAGSVYRVGETISLRARAVGAAGAFRAGETYSNVCGFVSMVNSAGRSIAETPQMNGDNDGWVEGNIPLFGGQYASDTYQIEFRLCPGASIGGQGIVEAYGAVSISIAPSPTPTPDPNVEIYSLVMQIGDECNYLGQGVVVTSLPGNPLPTCISFEFTYSLPPPGTRVALFLTWPDETVWGGREFPLDASGFAGLHWITSGTQYVGTGQATVEVRVNQRLAYTGTFQVY